MKMEDVIAKIVTEFGTDSEKTNCDKVTALFVKAAGDRDVPDRVANKVISAGRQLRKMGIS
jgi:hypothetical protein